MSSLEALKISSIDHIEFAVTDLEKAIDVHLRLGFEKAGQREIKERKLRSQLLTARSVYLLLTQSQEPNDPVCQYISKHGDGIFNIAFQCEDPVSALETLVTQGAETQGPPRAFQKDFGKLEQTAILALGDMTHSFVRREGQLFGEGFEIPFRPVTDRGTSLIYHHLGLALPTDSRGRVVEYYSQLFGLRPGDSEFSLRSPKGEFSLLLQTPDCSSRIADFLEVHHGLGFEHLALSAENLADVELSLSREGISFHRRGTPFALFTSPLLAGVSYEFVKKEESVAGCSANI